MNKPYDPFYMNAVLERITAVGETFDIADAKYLIENVPDIKFKGPSFTYNTYSKGESTKGYAAGIGDVNIEGEEKKKTYSLNAPKEQRIGGYTIEHYAGDMVISLMWADTHEDMTGKKCILVYNKKTKEPIELKLVVERAFALFGLRLAFAAPAKWKKPHV